MSSGFAVCVDVHGNIARFVVDDFVVAVSESGDGERNFAFPGGDPGIAVDRLARFLASGDERWNSSDCGKSYQNRTAPKSYSAFRDTTPCSRRNNFRLPSLRIARFPP